MKEKIKEMLLIAMKSNDSVLRTKLRYINSLIAKKEKDTGLDISDSDIISIIKKERKEIEDTLSLIAGAGREDEIYNLNYVSLKLDELIPKQLTEEELRAKIDDMFSFSEFPNMGCAMKAVLGTSLSDVADKSLIAKIVKEKFNN